MLKEQILKLKNEGKSHNAIAEILGCCKSSVAYHTNPEIKQKHHIRQRAHRKAFMVSLKMEHGGKCQICGYNRCLEVLDFHHTNPKNKITNIGQLTESVSHARAREEASKCILLCSNCHRELHLGVVKI